MVKVKEDDVIISAKGLSRTYKVLEAEGGLLRRLFSNNYKEIKAVDNISFNVRKGEIVGLIGPNGAGKSTTIKIMTGILAPTCGKITVLGKDPFIYRKTNAQKIGVVFGQRTQLWWDLPLSDTFKLLKNMYKISDEIYKNNLNVFWKELDIGSFWNRPVRQLSLGQRMRGEIAAAMLHNPDILFLDEPTIGLDIVAKQQVQKYIKKINTENNVTIILTTHDMREIENLCKKIILINSGRVILDMPLSEVRARFNKTHDIVITFATTPSEFSCVDGCKIVKKGDMEYIFRIEDSKINMSDFIGKCIYQYDVLDISIQRTDIEEIVRGMYR